MFLCQWLLSLPADFVMGYELASLKAAIQQMRGTEAADMFTPETLKLLWDQFYRTEASLMMADKQTLLQTGLPGGLADALEYTGECWPDRGWH